MPQLLWCVHFHSWLPRASSTTQFVTSHSCLWPKLVESFLSVFFVIGLLQSFPDSLYSTYDWIVELIYTIMMCMMHDLNPPRMIIGSTNSNNVEM